MLKFFANLFFFRLKDYRLKSFFYSHCHFSIFFIFILIPLITTLKTQAMIQSPSVFSNMEDQMNAILSDTVNESPIQASVNNLNGVPVISCNIEKTYSEGEIQICLVQFIIDFSALGNNDKILKNCENLAFKVSTTGTVQVIEDQNLNYCLESISSTD